MPKPHPSEETITKYNKSVSALAKRQPKKRVKK